MILFNHISNTAQSLRANRTRNFLTILGIAIGAACISLVLALTNGANQLLVQTLDNYKPGTVLIRPTDPKLNRKGLLDLNTNDWVAGSGLPATDLTELAKIEGIISVTPVTPFSASIFTKGKKLDNQLVVGTTDNLIKTVNIELTKGQFLSDKIVENAVVVGHELALDLFNTENCVGQTFEIRGQNYLVVGVVKQPSYQPQTDSINLATTVIMNIAEANRLADDTAQIKQINLQTSEGVDLSQLESKIKQVLSTTHSGEDNFTIITRAPESTPINPAYVELSQATLIVAVIALVIGGIGVMNIMLVNVAEQTREIGIRRSVGATGKDILGQFLTESIIISLLGGIAGLVISFVLTFAFKAILPFPAVYDWILVTKVLAVTLITGAIAGIIPAIKAVTKDPIESLRQF